MSIVLFTAIYLEHYMIPRKSLNYMLMSHDFLGNNFMNVSMVVRADGH